MPKNNQIIKLNTAVKSTGGRPSDYTSALADEICDAVAENCTGLENLCAANKHWPSARTIHRWLLGNEEFCQHYARAKVVQTEIMVDNMYRIIITSKPEEAAKTRLLIDAIKWKACKLVPKVYGDKVDARVEVSTSPDDFVLYLNKLKVENQKQYLTPMEGNDNEH